MNNLKRVLSLALASVMLIGMMVVGASAADFTDAEEIQHVEAVDTLVALGVVNGKEDGSYFDPTGDVTRAEMAKMITVAMMGGNDVNTGVKGIPSFTDTAGHWAESYIEYCYDMGIISGRGDGTFDPNAKVTTTEATKMVLTALGYDSEAYKLTGAQWATRTDELARTADPSLYEDLTGVTLSQPATRDTAAQIIWNGLQNNTKKVTPSTNTSTGEVTWQYNDGNTLLYERYNGQIWIGTMVGNYDTSTAANEGEITVNGKIEGSTNALTNASFPSDLSISNIGEEIKVIFKDGTAGTKNKPDNKDTIYGVFNTGSTQVYWTTKAGLKKNADITAADHIGFGGSEYTVAAATVGDTMVVVDYGAAAGTTSTLGTVAEAKATFGGLRTPQNSDKIKFVTDADGKICKAYVETQNISFVTSVNGDKITLNNVGTIKISENDVYDDVAKYDVVNYTKFYKADKDQAKFTITKAEAVTGELTGYKIGTGSDAGLLLNVVIDGKSYNTYGKATTGVNIDSKTGETNATMSDDMIGETFTAYLINGLVKYIFQDTDSARSLAVIKSLNSNNLGSNLNAPKVELLLADGSKVTATVDSDSTLYEEAAHAGTVTPVADNDSTAIDKVNVLAVGDIVRYSVTSSGTYKLVEITTTAHDGYTLAYNDTAAAAKVYDDDTKSISANTTNGTDGTWTVTSGDCVLFIGTTAGGNSSWKTYKIRDLDDFSGTGTNKIRYVVKDGKAIAAYLETATKPAGAASDTVYGVVSTYTGTRKVDGDSYYVYKVENDEDTYDVLINNNTYLKTGKIVSFEPSSDNTYKNADITIIDGSTLAVGNGLATWVKEYSAADKTLTYYQNMAKVAGVFTGSNPKTVAIDDKVVISYVNMDDEEAGSDIGISEFNTGTGYRNVLLVPDTNGKIIGIVVESSGEADVMGSSVVAYASTDPAIDTIAEINALLTAGNNLSLTSATAYTAADAALVLDNGSLTVEKDFTVTNQNITVKDGQTLTVGGNLSAGTGTITVEAGGVLKVTGTTTATTINIAGEATLTGAVSANVALTGAGRLTSGAIAGTLGLAGTASANVASVSGAITDAAGTTLVVTGAETLAAATEIKGTATFGGAVTTTNTNKLTVTGTVTLNGAVADSDHVISSTNGAKVTFGAAPTAASTASNYTIAGVAATAAADLNGKTFTWSTANSKWQAAA